MILVCYICSACCFRYNGVLYTEVQCVSNEYNALSYIFLNARHYQLTCVYCIVAQHMLCKKEYKTTIIVVIVLYSYMTYKNASTKPMQKICEKIVLPYFVVQRQNALYNTRIQHCADLTRIRIINNGLHMQRSVHCA